MKSDSRIGIVNRGEAALRFIRGVREYNSRYGTSIEAVAIYNAKEEQSPFVKNADDRVCFEDLQAFPGTASTPYLDHELIISALEKGGCDALWVGWGFVSEDSVFAEKTEAKGLVFLGPSSKAMALLGDKIAAKDLAESADVPILPWSKGPVETIEDAEKVSNAIGYPVIVKASNAGGGRGIRFVLTPEELKAQYNSAVDETLRITGTRTVFIEHLVQRGRHLEVQVLADSHGHVNTFGVRDCSVQRRNQKIIEETPPPGLPEEKILAMQEAAARLINAADYVGAGTVEYLYDLDSDRYFFMEVNTRLQVEHPITEELYGIDLVTGQIEVAAGLEVDLSDAFPRGHVMEVRLNAEDPGREFSPAPGGVDLFRSPAGPGIRVDSGIETGAEIPPEFDSMVAKIIARGRNRQEAMARLKRALDECTIRIENGTTNRSFLRQLLDQEEIIAGGVSTGFVAELLQRGITRPPEEDFRAALIAGAVTVALKQLDESRVNFLYDLSSVGKPRTMPRNSPQEVSLTLGGTSYQLEVYHVGGERYHIGVDDQFIVCHYRCSLEEEGVLEYNNKRYRFLLVHRGDALQCEINGVPFLLEQESRGFVKSPSPAIILSIPVKPGDSVKKGDVLLVLEAMKMEMLIEAPGDGVVADILAGPGSQVAAGQSLIRLEEEEDGKEEAVDEVVETRVTFDQKAPSDEELWQRIGYEIRALFLGFDTGDAPVQIINRLRSLKNDSEDFKQRLTDLTSRALEKFCAVEGLFSSSEIDDGTGGGRPHSFTELLTHYALRKTDREKGLPAPFIQAMERVIENYRKAGINDDIDQLLFHIYRSHNAVKGKAAAARELLLFLEEAGDDSVLNENFPLLVNEIVRISIVNHPNLADAALHARYILLDKAHLSQQRDKQRTSVGTLIKESCSGCIDDLDNKIDAILELPPAVLVDLLRAEKSSINKDILAQIVTKYLNRDRDVSSIEILNLDGDSAGAAAEFPDKDNAVIIIADQKADVESLLKTAAGKYSSETCEFILLLPFDADAGKVIKIIAPFSCRFLSIGVYGESDYPSYTTYHNEDGDWKEWEEAFSFSPLEYRELRVARLKGFHLKLVSRTENVTVLEGTARENAKDMRLFALASTSETDPELSSMSDLTRMVRFEQVFMEAVSAMRAVQQGYRFRLQWNRIIIYNRSLLGLKLMQLRDFGLNLVPRTAGLGLEKMVVYTRRKRWREETIREHELIFHNLTQDQFTLRSRKPSGVPLTTLDAYGSKVVRARQRNQIYPYELIKMLTHAGFPLQQGVPRGEFEEFDIEVESNGATRMFSVKGRDPGNNSSNVVIGRIENTDPETGIAYRRMLILSDPTSDLGSLAEGECRRINAAIDMAETEKIPVEWIPVSSGAKITMDSGTENLDWTAATLKRIIEFTQGGGEINIIVQSINVGAQSYWDAESTMLMHTRGLLLMTDDASMLLTGKRALDFSGSVSGETNVDIGGAEKIMLPNGQAQIRVANIAEAYAVLFQHYRVSYVIPGEDFPRIMESTDSEGRDVTSTAYTDSLGQGFTTIGDIFSLDNNPDRKKPFDMRQVMRALVDQDGEILERWRNLEDGDTALVWETRLGGQAVGMIGIESRSFSRIGAVPPDGPDTWSGGTLYPQSSKKVARGINSFSGRLPAVIIANLSGFDGSPESLRRLQLEYGAEIGRAVVNFKGPLVFLVTARYHGGAYVVFSKKLNPSLEVAALEGSFASVIGGAPAAAVVFPKTVKKQTEEDTRIVEERRKLKNGDCTYKEFEMLYQTVYNEYQTALGAEFDSIHSVGRAREVGSIDNIINPAKMRPYLIDAVRRGMQRWIETKK